MKQILFVILLVSVQIASAQTANDNYIQATISFDNGDFKNALKLIDKAIKMDAKVIDFYRLKVDTQVELKKYQEAYETCNEVITIYPDTAHLYMTRGNLMLSYHEFDLAIEDYTKTMDLTEDDSLFNFAITNRAAAKMSKRDFNSAYEDLLIAYVFDSTDLATLTNLGAVCDDIGREEETIKYLLKALEVDPTFYPAYVNIGFSYQGQGEYKKAIEYFDKVVENDPEEALGYSNRNFCKLKLGDVKGAMADIEKSIKLYPSNSYAYRNRALIYLENKKMAKACDDLQKAIDLGFTVTYGEEVEDLQRKHCRDRR